MTQTLERDLRAARRVSTPLIGIKTADTPAACAHLLPILTPAPHLDNQDVPILYWDAVRGITVANGTQETAKARAMLVQTVKVEAALVNPVTMLDACHYLPANGIVIVFNAHLAMAADPRVKQALCNLRDPFKSNGRSIIMMGRTISVPPELEGDVVVYVDPLPDRPRAAAIINQVFKDSEVPLPPGDVLDRAVDATRGLGPYAIEQNAALSITPETIEVDALQARRCAVIEQTQGLSVYTGNERFASIGGCANVKGFFGRVIQGRAKPTCVVFMDEIEKAMGGTFGDTSGTSQDQLMQILMFMQDKRSSGALLLGHPGCAKSVLAKAIGAEAGVLTLQFDLGAMKGSLVGQSEERIREALRVVDNISDGRALFVATCNKIASLPPELRRRFKFGTFFFDLPTADERDIIWKIYLKKFDVKNPGPRPDDTNWTGAEIEQCVEFAWMLDTTLVDASQYVVVSAIASADAIEHLRVEADGRFISASVPGAYRYSQASSAPVATSGRKIRTTTVN